MPNLRTLIALVLMLVIPALPAAATTPGGHSGADAALSNSYAASGPGAPGLAWERPIESSLRGDWAIDAEGHVLVRVCGTSQVFQCRAGSPDELEIQLLALDPADGSVAWTADDVGGWCAPVAGDDGAVYAHSDDNERVVAYDAVTGQQTASMQIDYRSTFGPPAEHGCRLVLAPDGTLLVDQSSRLLAYDTSGGTLSEKWVYEVARDGDPGTYHDIIESPRVSPDGTTVYVAAQVGNSDDGLVEIRSLDLASGDETGRVDVTQDDTGEIAYLAAGASGVAVGLDNSVFLHVSDDPDGLSVGYRVDDSTRPGIRWAITDGLLVSHLAASSRVAAHRLVDGQVVWESEDGNWLNELIADADGNTYIETADGLASLDPTGQERWRLQGCAGDRGATHLAPTAIGADGTLYALAEDDIGGQVSILALADGAPVGSCTLQGGEPSSGGPDTVPPGEPGVARIEADGDVREAAIKVCQLLRPDPDSAARVLVSRDDAFADALAGSSLLNFNSCILYSGGGPDSPLDPRVRVEIDRALPPGGEIALLGGSSAVSDQVEAELVDAGYDVTRYAGPTRYETAVQIAQRASLQQTNSPFRDVILANGQDWPDALTAGGYAAIYGTPVVLTPPDSLHPEAQRFLDTQNFDQTWVVGGQAVVSQAAAPQTPNPVRVAGSNRMGTARAIAEQMWGEFQSGEDYVFVNLEHPQGWTLALSAASLSVDLAGPQLGMRTGSLPGETDAYLQQQSFTQTPAAVLMGDDSFISSTAAQQVDAAIQP